MHILIAPNAFKNSLDAPAVAAAIDEGLKQSNFNGTTTCFPVGDGGDGTGRLLIQHCNGIIIDAIVNDPLGRKINSSFGLIDNGTTAVIEMADASGLRLLKEHELKPLQASSFGTGELIKQALDKNVNKIIICIGGSATVDGGAGILAALGFRFTDKHKKEIRAIPEKLADLDEIDVSGADQRIKACTLVLLCDVENNLLGGKGAAAVFGPQKGASPADVEQLEAALTRLKEIIFRQTGIDISLIKHGGAAGGVAAGLAGLVNAQPVNGIEHFLSLTQFDTKIEKADVVITGEGSIDVQTLQGKGPFGVAVRAKKKKIPVIGLAGKIPSEIPAELYKYFDALLSINPEDMPLADAIKNTRQNLIRTATSLPEMIRRLS